MADRRRGGTLNLTVALETCRKNARRKEWLSVPNSEYPRTAGHHRRYNDVQWGQQTEARLRKQEGDTEAKRSEDFPQVNARHGATDAEVLEGH